VGTAANEAGTERTETTAPGAELPPIGCGTELRARFRYRLIERLGKGSFGSVFYARCLDADPRRDDSPPEFVAVKILARGGGAVDTLRRELSALLTLEHDCIPRVHDWCFEGDYAFMVIEHFESGSLRDVMPLQGPVEEETVWRLLADLLSALDVAHKASLLHLDIKPANVLLDGNGGFVLTDFGVSQASRISGQLLPFSVGTRGYQAPEQKKERFDQYDLRTDLFSAGATAWALATGINLAERPSLVRDDENESAYALPPLSDWRIYCSEELESVIMSMLYLEPSLRPGSVAEVLARVRAKVGGMRFDSHTLAATRRANVDEAEVDELIDSLVDPLLVAICRRSGFRRYFVKFEDGEAMCAEGEQAYYAFLLLRGTVVISRAERELTRISREGSFLYEVATLCSLPRTASLSAAGPVWACVLNAAELERFVTCNPAMGLRVIRSMADRLSRVPGEVGGKRPDDD